MADTNKDAVGLDIVPVDMGHTDTSTLQEIAPQGVACCCCCCPKF